MSDIFTIILEFLHYFICLVFSPLVIASRGKTAEKANESLGANISQSCVQPKRQNYY